MKKVCGVLGKSGLYLMLCSLLLGALSGQAVAALRFLTLDSGTSVGVPDVAIMDINHDGQLEWVYAQRGFSSALVSGKYTDNPPTQINREQVPLADLNDAIEPTLLVPGDQNGDGKQDLVIFRGQSGPSPAPGFRLVQRDNSALGSGTIANYQSEIGDTALYAIDADGGKAFNETGTKTSFAAYYAGANESVWSRDTAAIGSGTWCRDQFDNAGSGCTNAIGALGDFNGDGNADVVRAYPGCDNGVGIRSSNGGTSCPATWSSLIRVGSGLGIYHPRDCQISNGNCGTPNGFNMLVIAAGNELRIYEPDAASYGTPMVNEGAKGPFEVIATRPSDPLQRFSAVEVADLNNDGTMEIIAGTYNGEVIAYWRNNPTSAMGSGYWASVNLLDGFPGTSSAPIGGIAVGDLDGDTRVEVMVGNNYPDGAPDAGGKVENAIIIDGLDTLNAFSGTTVITPTPTISPTPTSTFTPTSTYTPKPFTLRYLTLNTGTSVGIPDVAIMDIDQDSNVEWVYVQRGFNSALASGKYTDNPPTQVNREEVPLAGLNDAVEPSLIVSGDQNGDGKADLTIFRGQTGGAPAPGFRLVQRDNSALGSGTITNYLSELGDAALYAIDVDGGKAFNEAGTKTSLGAWYAGANESVWSRDTAAIGSGTWCRMEFDNAGSGCTNAIGALGDWNGDGSVEAIRAYATCNNELGIRSSNGGTTCIPGFSQWPSLVRITSGVGTFQPRTCQISNGDIGTPNGYSTIVIGVGNDLRIYEYGGTYGSPFVGNPDSAGEIIVTRGSDPTTRFTCVEYGDLDGDGIQEIIAGTYDGKLFAYFRSNPFAPLPVITGFSPIAPGPWQAVDLLVDYLLPPYSGISDAPVTGIAVGDLDKDGKVEVLMGNNYPDGDPAAGSKRENAIIIDGLEAVKFSLSTVLDPTPTPTLTPTATPTAGCPDSKYLTLESQTGTAGVGFPDVAVIDIDHDNKPEIVYAERGITNSLVSIKYADGGNPRVTVREAIPLSGLNNAIEPRLLGVGDQNGDGLADLIISGNVNNPGFRLVQRNNSSLGSGTIASYATEAEVRDGVPFANDIDVGKALNEAGTKTSFGAWYTGWDESIWSRDNAAIGSGTWCQMAFDNAGSGCTDSAGALGDFNGDGFTDGVRSYSGCNNETGVRGNLGGVVNNICDNDVLHTPIELDRVAYNLGKFIPRCCRISDGSVNTPHGYNVLVAANAASLRVFEYDSAGTYGQPMPSNGNPLDPSPQLGAPNPFEIIVNNPTAQETVNSTSIARFGDLDGDGILEIVIGTYDGRLIACKRTNSNDPFGSGYWIIVDLLCKYTLPHNAPVTGLAIANLDDDPQMEIVFSNDFPDASGNTAVTTHVVVIEPPFFTAISNWQEY